MANEAVRMVSGVGCNAAFYTRWLAAEPLYQKLMFKRLDLFPFTEDFHRTLVPPAIHIASTVRFAMEGREAILALSLL